MIPGRSARGDPATVQRGRRRPIPRPGAGRSTKNLTAEAEYLGWASTGLEVDRARALDELSLLDESTEVRFVEPTADEGFDHTLELVQRECLREELKHDRAVGELATEPVEGGSNDPSVVERHRTTERRRQVADGAATFGRGLWDTSGRIEQLIPIEDSGSIPRTVAAPEGDRHPIVAGRGNPFAVGPLRRRRGA